MSEIPLVPAGVALVTGATGFVGSALVKRLLSERFEVRALTAGGSRERLADVADRIVWFGLDAAGIVAAVQGVSHFYNFAVIYDRPNYSDALIHDVNVGLPLRIIDALSGSKQPVTCVLGDTFNRKFPVEATRQPRYTDSKNRLAAAVAALPVSHPCRIALLLIEQMYGPGDSFDKVFPGVVRQLLQGVARIPLTTGTQRRDFIHVTDTVEAALVVARGNWVGCVSVGCGSGKATAVRDVFERLAYMTQSRSVLGFGDLAADQAFDESVADVRWLNQRGFSCCVPLEKGLHDLIDDVRWRSGAGDTPTVTLA